MSKFTTCQSKLSTRAPQIYPPPPPHHLFAATLAAVSLLASPLTPPPSFARASMTPEERTAINVFQKTTPSVVSISNLSLRLDIFSDMPTEEPQGFGSGVIWDKEGHIVTNLHVVRDAIDLGVTIGGGMDKSEELEFAARVIGVDYDKDLAVLDLLEDTEHHLLLSNASVAAAGPGPVLPNKLDIPPPPLAPSQPFVPAPPLATPLFMSPMTPIPPPPPPPPPSAASSSITAASLKPIRRGTSSDLIVGQKVFALGAPFGLENSMTSGIISSVHREIPSGINGKPIEDVIQTDCAINPGNSGGPLLDSAGDMIGVNTAIYSPSGGSTGVGFSIPVDTMEDSVNQILKTGRVSRPFLGVTLAPDMTLKNLGMKGVMVLQIKPDSPAFKVGIKATGRDEFGRVVLGDIIVKANEAVVKNSSDLFRVLNRLHVGDTLRLEVLRDHARDTIEIVLEERGF